MRALGSARVADVPAGTFGPYVGDTASGGVVVWAQASADGVRRWRSVALDAAGTVSKQKVLGPAPKEVGLAIVEPLGKDSSRGFVLVSTRADVERGGVEALVLDPKGEAHAGSAPLGEVAGRVIWIDVVVTTGATLALWAVRGADGADLFSVALGAAGAPMSAPREIARKARAWQATPFGAGAVVGMVVPADDATTGLGRVETVVLDPNGEPGARTVVSASATAEPDLDLVPSGRGLLLAWSDRREAEPRVALAALDATGKVSRAPAPAAPSLGEQGLVRLVAPHGGGPAYLAWEELLDRPASGRSILLATVSPDGALGEARTVLEHASEDGSVPELVATARGLAALTLAPACKAKADCTGAPRLPTFVELGERLQTVASAPLLMTALGGEAPDLAWGLSCARARCWLLAAQAKDPAPVYAVRLDPTAGTFREAARPMVAHQPPRVAALDLFGAGQPVADVALAKSGESRLAAWITYFDPATPWTRLPKPSADGRFEPLRASLLIRPLAESGKPAPAAQPLSQRAESLGGVALAPSQSSPAEVLVGWTAIDAKVAQVFATVVDPQGKKLRQRMVTRAPGVKTDVAAAGARDGWVMAWVDERSGDPELYANKLNRLLQAAGPDRRITSAKGSASDVALLTLGDDVLAAWSDSRDAERPGWADIWVTTLKGLDGAAAAPERRLIATGLHSRSPSLAALGKGAAIAWIDSAPADAGGDGRAEVRVAELDATGKLIAEPSLVRFDGAVPTSVVLDCDADRCHVVVSASVGERAERHAFDWAPGRVGAPRRLSGLAGPAQEAVAPTLLGRELLVADNADGQGRVRRVLIDWK